LSRKDFDLLPRFPTVHIQRAIDLLLDDNEIPEQVCGLLAPKEPALGTERTNTIMTNSTRRLCASAFLLAAMGTVTVYAAGPAKVALGKAGYFVILSKSGITDVPTSTVTGNVGTSPITGAADHLTCTEVTGLVFSVDAAGPSPCSIKDPHMLTTAIGYMQLAYTDAATRPNPDFLNMGGGNIGGLTLAPGLYKWGSGVTVPTDATISGDSNSVWIFQISGNLMVADGAAVRLSGGAQARHIFWQVAGKTVLGTTSQFEGIVLCKTLISMKTGASIRGRLLAQTAVTLQKNTVSRPVRLLSSR
jgi:hypothetical protein